MEGHYLILTVNKKPNYYSVSLGRMFGNLLPFSSRHGFRNLLPFSRLSKGCTLLKNKCLDPDTQENRQTSTHVYTNFTNLLSCFLPHSWFLPIPPFLVLFEALEFFSYQMQQKRSPGAVVAALKPKSTNVALGLVFFGGAWIYFFAFFSRTRPVLADE